MTLNNIFQFFVPKDKKFFPLFEQASANLILLAEILNHFKLIKFSIPVSNLMLLL